MAGFNLARKITKTSATGFNTGHDDYDKGIGSPRSSVNNPVRYNSPDSSFSLKGQVVFDVSNVTKWQILFDFLQSTLKYKLSAFKLFQKMSLSNFS